MMRRPSMILVTCAIAVFLFPVLLVPTAAVAVWILSKALSNAQRRRREAELIRRARFARLFL